MSNIEIIRGNNFPPVQWQFLASTNPDVIFPLNDSVFKLTVKWLTPPNIDTIIALSSDIDAQLTVDLETSILSWTYSVTDSRSMISGSSVSYEIERWIDGTQQTMVRGLFIISEGLNPD